MKIHFKTISERIIRDYIIRLSIVNSLIVVFFGYLFFISPSVLIIKFILGDFFIVSLVFTIFIITSIAINEKKQLKNKLTLIKNLNEKECKIIDLTENFGPTIKFAITYENYGDFILGKKYSCFSNKDWRKIKRILKQEFFELKEKMVIILMEEKDIENSKLAFCTYKNNIFYII